MQTHFIRVPKSYLQCWSQHQSWRAATTHSNMFSVLQLFYLQFIFINSNVSNLSIRISSCGSVVRALRLISVRLPIQVQPVCFCPSGVSAPALLNLRKPNPLLRHGGLPPRDNSFFCRNFKDSTTVYKSGTLRKLSFHPFN